MRMPPRLRPTRSQPSLLALGSTAPDQLNEGELLSELLAQPIERSLDLLHAAGGMTRLRSAGVGHLVAKGWSPKLAARLIAAREFHRRVETIASEDRMVRIENPRDVFRWAGQRLVALEHEELWMLALNPRNRILATRVVATGGASGVRTTTGDVLRAAFNEGASAFVLAHNHPSGDPTPSDEDLRFTEKMVAAARACDLPLLDHVVVAKGGFSSALRSP